MTRALAACGLIAAALAAPAPASAATNDVIPKGIAENVATTGARTFVGVLETRFSRTADGRGATARFLANGGDNRFFISRRGKLKVQVAVELRCAGGAAGSQPVVHVSKTYTVTVRKRGEHLLRTRSLVARCDAGAKPAGDPGVNAWLCLRRASGTLWAANEYGGARACAAAERAARQLAMPPSTA